MSDFLQFVDRIPTLPNRKKLTFENDGSVKYATVEYADEPTEEGTFLNKYNFNKLNAVLGYNECIASENDINNRIDFTINIDTDNLVDNQRFLLKQINNYNMPQIGIDKLIASQIIGDNYNYPNVLELSNGNIMIVGSKYGTYEGYLTIINKQGETIKASTQIHSDLEHPALIELSNNNILISGGTTNYYLIVDINGNVIYSGENLGGTVTHRMLVKLNNNNILMASYNYNSTHTGYFAIFDENGNIIKTLTTIGDYFCELNAIQLNNNNIMFIGNARQYSGYGLYIAIIDEDGNFVKNRTYIADNFRASKSIKLSNGNVAIVGCDGSSNIAGYGIIIDSAGTASARKTLPYTYKYNSPNLVELNNGNIMISSCNSDSDQTGYVIVVDPINFNTVVSQQGVGIYLENSYFIKDNDNVILIGSGTYSGASRASLVVLDSQINKIIEQNVFNNSANNKTIKLTNGNYFMVGNYNGSTYRGYINYLKIKTFVQSPTFNGKNIDKYFIKDNYYELIYNEATDNYTIKSNKEILVDITLNESVNQVNLSGISNMLEDGKLYSLIVNGKSSSNSNLNFGNGYLQYIYNVNYESSISLFAVKEINGYKYVSGIGMGSNGTTCYTQKSQITNYEYIKVSGSATISAGTRIIIKEVC